MTLLAAGWRNDDSGVSKRKMSKVRFWIYQCGNREDLMVTHPPPTTWAENRSRGPDSSFLASIKGQAALGCNERCRRSLLNLPLRWTGTCHWSQWMQLTVLFWILDSRICWLISAAVIFRNCFHYSKITMLYCLNCKANLVNEWKSPVLDIHLTFYFSLCISHFPYINPGILRRLPFSWQNYYMVSIRKTWDFSYRARRLQVNTLLWKPLTVMVSGG